MPDFEIIHERSESFFDNFDRKADLQHQTHYCPGCGHGVAHKLIAEALEDMGLQDKAIFVSPVGCSVFAYYYFHVGNVQVAHGRAPAAATALKRSRPDSMVISYQGDGDLAAIGTAEIIHAANRGENITVFFVNNAIYGMTGGQMAPTTLVGMSSTTSPWGRRPNNEGFPIKVSEMLSTLEAPVYIERVSLGDPKQIMKARKAVRKALENQRDGKGFSLVEILSPCPTIWKKDPIKARQFVAETMQKAFPLGVYRDKTAEPLLEPVPVPQVSVREVLGLNSTDAPVQKHPGHTRDMAIKFAGFGGQGILLLGQLVAEMGMREGLDVSWLPSYGPEMRSGSAHCYVMLSHDRVSSPLTSHPDVLIAMNEISLRKFGAEVKPNGTIIYNGDVIPADLDLPAAEVVCVPASKIADSLGATKTANVVMLGALLTETGCLPEGTAMNVIEKMVKNTSMLDMNRKALDAGKQFIETKRWMHAVSQPDGFAD